MNHISERYYRARLLSLPGIKRVQLRRLLAFFGGIREACAADGSSWLESGAFGAEQLNPIRAAMSENSCEAYAEELQLLGIRIILPDDDEYPQLLGEIADPPELLYAQGALQLKDLACVAVVGSRHATQYGRRVAEELAADLCDCGICVVSGLARGIDSAAHRGALTSRRSQTCAVVGTGLDIVYPGENRKLAQEIRESGILLSEYPLNAGPQQYHFPARNRIISGISLGVLVVEAGEKSGTQITVNCALEQGREVFAIPGSIYAANSRGPHQLIKQGARLVESVDDILDELHLLSHAEDREVSAVPDLNLNLLQMKLLSILEREPMHFDRLQEESKLPVGTLQSELMQLELHGLVLAQPGRFYALKRIKSE